MTAHEECKAMGLWVESEDLRPIEAVCMASVGKDRRFATGQGTTRSGAVRDALKNWKLKEGD